MNKRSLGFVMPNMREVIWHQLTNEQEPEAGTGKTTVLLEGLISRVAWGRSEDTAQVFIAADGNAAHRLVDDFVYMLETGIKVGPMSSAKIIYQREQATVTVRYRGANHLFKFMGSASWDPKIVTAFQEKNFFLTVDLFRQAFTVPSLNRGYFEKRYPPAVEG